MIDLRVTFISQKLSDSRCVVFFRWLSGTLDSGFSQTHKVGNIGVLVNFVHLRIQDLVK